MWFSLILLSVVAAVGASNNYADLIHSQHEQGISVTEGFHNVLDSSSEAPTQKSLRSQRLHEQISSTTYPPTDEDRHLMARMHHEFPNESRNLQISSTIQVPIYVHMLLNESAPLLNHTHIIPFVRTLNKAFKSSPFYFVLNGIDATFNNTYAQCENETIFKSQTRGLAEDDGSDVLHIWICNTNSLSPGYVGWSYFPPITRSLESYMDGLGE
jgi:hypothetical protein